MVKFKWIAVGIGLVFTMSVLFLWLFLVHTKTILNCSAEIVHNFTYPVAMRNESIIDYYHGKQVADPYRWLEDPDSEETRNYVEAVNKITRPYLENCEQWKRINEKLTKLWNHPKYDVPSRHGKYYFPYMNTGLQNQFVLYKQDSLTSEPTVLLDPNTLSTDGTISLQEKSFSEDGSLLAYGLSESGSDWIKIKIRDVETGKDFPDLLGEVKFSSMSWTHDNKGFFYCRYPDQSGKTDGSETFMNENQKLYYHRVGESQEQDVLVVEFPENPLWQISAEVSHCGKYLILTVNKDLQENLLYFADLEEIGEIKGKIFVEPIIAKFDAYYDYITNTDTKMVLQTNKNAPNYRIIVIDLENPGEKNWTTLVPEHPNDVLDWAQCVHKDKLVINYLHDVKSALHVHSLEDGKLIRTLPLEIGQIAAFSGDKKYSEIFYQFESFLTPETIYQYDFAKPDVEPSVLREVKLKLDGFDKNNFIVEQVFYPSRDGTKIPMFIVQKKSDSKKLKPCLLYGYGGFGVSLGPTFSEKFLFFVDAFDGVVAIPNIRGGGEYGKNWHNSGRGLNKQNSYDDFQAAAEYLVKNNYTEHKQIAIQGGSNGGLLVAVSINQRPELFGAAVVQVGVIDLLRFHKFTIGHAWTSDYGNPDEKVYFDNLIKFSPLHNVHSPNSTENQYPATLIITADHDDRVSPLHSLKFAATLHHAVRDNKYQKNPILLRVYSKAGHGAGKPTTKQIKEATDILTFLCKALHIEAEV